MLRRFRSLGLGLILVYILQSAAFAQEAKEKPEKPTSPPASAKPLNADDDYQLVQTLVDVIDEVERHYVKDIDRKELLKAAIKGVMSKLDPYSNYIPPDEIAHFKESLESEF